MNSSHATHDPSCSSPHRLSYPDILQPDYETIVLLHGMGLSQEAWGTLPSLMSDKYNIWTYNLPGHGRRPVLLPLSWEALMTDFDQMTRPCAEQRIHLVGHGIGANLAVKLAAHQPERIHTLSLISARGYVPGSVTVEAMNYRRQLLQAGRPELLFHHITMAITNRPQHSAEFSLLLNAFRQADLTTYMSLMELFLQTDVLRDFSRLEAPTLLLSGELDLCLSPALTAITASYAKQARFRIVPRSSNACHLDAPELVAEWIMEHCEAGRSTLSQQQLPYSPISTRKVRDKLHQVILAGQQLLKEKNRLEVYTLGTFRVFARGVEIVQGWNRRSAKELLIYLLLHPTVTRQQLYDRLWPDVDLKSAQNRLRVSLSHLKQLLTLPGGENKNEYLMIDREHISLRADIECDLLTLLESIADWSNEPDETLRETIAQNLLDTYRKDGLNGYCEDWFLDIRRRIEEDMENIVIWYLERLRQGGHEQKVHKYERLLEEEPSAS
ncbi:alpha/beta hydrolase [Paenibacillus sp. YYML68]|uniref:alpha/beta hydrolase n=1 Tax=Paenibacillus sp. YYML68 TaxID=2909250 RepID=UPI00248FCEF9|nr:alpha/beta hydrolase [Paenibacillus sp. YYML68]